MSELVLDSTKDSISHAMDASSIQFFQVNSAVKIYVAQSKTDQLGRGAVLLLPEVKGKICPVKLLKQYSLQRSKIQGSFFYHFNRSSLTRY